MPLARVATRTTKGPSNTTRLSADVAASADVRGCRGECGCPRMSRRVRMSADVAASADVRGCRGECGCPRMSRRVRMSADVAASADVRGCRGDCGCLRMLHCMRNLGRRKTKKEKKERKKKETPRLGCESCRHFCALQRAGVLPLVIQGQTRPAQRRPEWLLYDGS